MKQSIKELLEYIQLDVKDLVEIVTNRNMSNQAIKVLINDYLIENLKQLSNEL